MNPSQLVIALLESIPQLGQRPKWEGSTDKIFNFNSSDLASIVSGSKIVLTSSEYLDINLHLKIWFSKKWPNNSECLFDLVLANSIAFSVKKWGWNCWSVSYKIYLHLPLFWDLQYFVLLEPACQSPFCIYVCTIK